MERFSCRKFGFYDVGAKADLKRLVYDSGGHGHGTPAPSLEDLANEAELEQVQAHREEIMQFEGFRMTHPFDEKVDAKRLGVRDEIAHLLDHSQPVAKQIINKKINDRIRERLQERQDKKSRWNPVSWFRGKNSVEKMLHEEFGTNRNEVAMKNFVSNRLVTKVLSALPPADLAEVAKAVGQTVGPYTDAQVGAFLRDASYMDLRNVRLVNNTAGTAIFKGNQDLENLLELRRGEVEEKTDTLSVVKFGPEHLRSFVAKMKEGKFVDKTGMTTAEEALITADEKTIYDLVTKQIPSKGWLDKLDTDPVAQAALAEVYTILQRNLSTKSTSAEAITATKEMLEKIRKDQPIKKSAAGGEKSENDKTLDKIDEQKKIFLDAAGKVVTFYNTAEELAGNNDTLTNEIAALVALIDNPPSNFDSRGASARLANKEKALHEQKRVNAAYYDKGNEAERDCKDKAMVFVKALNEAADGVIDQTTELKKLKDIGSRNTASVKEFFGRVSPDPNSIRELIQSLKTKDIDKEIADKYKSAIRPREKMEPRNFLVKLKETQFQKETDESRRMRLATLAANLAIVDAETVELDRAGNAEAAESIVGPRKLPDDVDTFTAHAIFLRVGNLEGLKPIRKLRVNSSPEEIRKVLKEMGTADLMKASEYLEQALLRKKVNDHQNIEIADSDWKLAKVLKVVRQMQAELRYREMRHKRLHPESEEEKKMTEAEWLAKYINQGTHDEEVARTGLRDKVKDHNGEFSDVFRTRSALMERFGAIYNRIEEEAKKQGLTGDARRKKFNEAGITDAVLELLAPSAGTVLLEKAVAPLGSYFWEGGKSKAGKGGIKGGFVAAYEKGLAPLGRGLWKVPGFLLKAFVFPFKKGFIDFPYFIYRKIRGRK